MGDFNLNLLNPSECFTLTQFLLLNDCTILNKIDEEFITRYQVYENKMVSKSIIDHFHTNFQVDYKFYIGESSLSDHNYLLLVVNKEMPSSPQSVDYKKVTNYRNVSRKLERILENWQSVHDDKVILARHGFYFKGLPDMVKHI